jgi:adenylate cyclase, class 2
VRTIGASRRNLELKARDRDPEGSHRTCEKLGAEDRGTLIQRDVYFDVPRGRLKLREEEGVAPCLIAYERPDLHGQKESRYRIVEVGDADELQEGLSTVLGIRGVVSKSRRLFVVEGVRIHLDRVDGLGDFIEFEGVIDPDDDGGSGRFEELLSELRSVFGIQEDDLVASSYADLALARVRT